jgi:hypothetical protein
MSKLVEIILEKAKIEKKTWENTSRVAPISPTPLDLIEM